MTRDSYIDELIRAIARQDVTDLQRALVKYHEYYYSHGKAKNTYYNENTNEIETFCFTHDDPERGIALVIRASR